MIYLKADTAVEVLIGPAVAVGDGFTPVTGLVGASADAYELIKYNGATALTAGAPTNALAAITGADGYYSLELATGDVDTEGPLWLVINDTSLILPIRHEFMVVNANTYDSFYAVAGTDTINTGSGINKNATYDNFEFLMVDETDGLTVETGLSPTGERSIDGAAFEAVCGSIAEVSDGIYQFDAVAADTNGDVITWKFSATGAADSFFTFETVA